MMGITNDSMTLHERMHAVAEYWREQRKFIKKNRPIYADPIPEISGQCNCDGAGWYYLLMPSGEKTLKKCTCGVAGASRIERKLNNELAALSHKNFANFDVNRKYIALPTVSVDTQRRMVDIAYKKAKEFAKNPTGWLYIHGESGTGKSHLAASIANHLARHQWNVVYRSMPAMLDIIRDSMHQGQVDTLFQEIADADLVIFDDVGADGTPTEWAEARIFRLINDRIDMPTVFTSNYDISDLPYQQRIKDRLNASRRCWINASSMRTPT